MTDAYIASEVCLPWKGFAGTLKYDHRDGNEPKKKLRKTTIMISMMMTVMMTTVHMWPGRDDDTPLGFSIASSLPGW